MPWYFCWSHWQRPFRADPRGRLRLAQQPDHKSPREKKLRILYFGLESGDDATLTAINKGYAADRMSELALMAREAGMGLSVTAILGLAGRGRSLEHARRTAAWVNRVNPEFFSLLTLFHRHNEQFHPFSGAVQPARTDAGGAEMLCHLAPAKTVLRSNHVSNFLNLAGSYPKDRERLLADVDHRAMAAARRACLLDAVPEYGEEYY